MASDGEMTKTKVIGLEEFNKFVVDNFFIWIRLVSQILILILAEMNKWGIKCIMDTWLMGGIVRADTHEAAGHTFKPCSRTHVYFHMKNHVTRFMEAAVASTIFEEMSPVLINL